MGFYNIIRKKNKEKNIKIKNVFEVTQIRLDFSQK